MKVNLSKQTLTAEALRTRLRAAREKSINVRGCLLSAVSDLDRLHSGAELQIFLREVDVLENVLDMALRYADSVRDQIRQESVRIEDEDRTTWGVSPEEFARQMREDQK